MVLDVHTGIGSGSTLGSTYVTHSMDEANNDFRLIYVPAKNYTLPASRPVYVDYENYPRVVDANISPSYAPVGNQKTSTPIGYIPQVAHTYSNKCIPYALVFACNASTSNSSHEVHFESASFDTNVNCCNRLKY